MITVVIPALNEEKTLRRVVLKVIACAEAESNIPIEIIIGNDGSTDRTAEISAALEREFPFVRVIQNPTNLGMGATFMSAVRIARYPKIAMFSGDDTIHSYTIRELLRNAEKADYVSAYVINTEHRSPFRCFLSSLYGLIYITTFRLNLRHVQTAPVFSVDCVRKLYLSANRYSLFCEIEIKMLRKGATFLELPGYMNSRDQKSSALRLKSMYEVVSSYFRLIYEIYFKHRAEYSRRPVRILPFEDHQE